MVDNTGYYKNQGTAGNIQLELQDDSGRRLNNGAAKLVQVDDSSQSASFPLKVRVLSVKGGATGELFRRLLTSPTAMLEQGEYVNE